LQGAGATTIICNQISVEQFRGKDRKGEIEQILVILSFQPSLSTEDTDVSVEVHSILDQFADVFAEPLGLPLRRADMCILYHYICII
jgi:hypothetical protein